MRYQVLKVEIDETNDKYEVGLDEIKRIIVDSAEKIIEIRYENERKVKLVPFEKSLHLIEEDTRARIHV